MTQKDKVLQHLQEHGSITPLEALKEYDCMRLGARIYDLKRAGHRITTERETAINNRGERVAFARYRMGART